MKKAVLLCSLLLAACSPSPAPSEEGETEEVQQPDDRQLESIPDDGQGVIYF